MLAIDVAMDKKKKIISLKESGRNMFDISTEDYRN